MTNASGRGAAQRLNVVKAPLLPRAIVERSPTLAESLMPSTTDALALHSSEVKGVKTLFV
jgi:hypothetical protein